MDKTSLSKKLIISKIIAVIIGIFLLFSALAKTQPITAFINNVYEQFPLQYTYSALLAQFIVSLEASLGIMLIMGLLGKKRWVLWATNILFIVFTIFIIYIWKKDGENADCGCLGEWVKLSPMTTLIKNIVLILLTTILQFTYRQEESKSRHIFTYVIMIILFCYTLLFYPAELDLNKLYTEDNTPLFTQVEHMDNNIDLREGQYIICFLSFTCSHCQTAAQNLSDYYQQDKSLPLIFVFNDKSIGNEEQRENFFSQLAYPDIPTLYISDELYRYYAGKSVPAIYLITDMVVNKKVDNYKKVTIKDLQDWHD